MINRRLLLLYSIGSICGLSLIAISFVVSSENPLTGDISFRSGVLITLVTVTASLISISREVVSLYKIVRKPGLFIDYNIDLPGKLVFWEFWSPLVMAEGELTIVYPDREKLPEAPGKITHDVKSIIKLITELNSNFGDFEYIEVNDQRFVETYRDNSIVCVSGPIANDISREVLRSLDLPIKFHKQEEIMRMLDENQGRSVSQNELDEKGIKDMVVGVDDTYETKKYSDSVPKKPKIKTDWGIITYIPSPYDSEYDIINVAGVFGPGTYGGFELLTSSDKLQQIEKDTDKYFQLVYRVPVDRNGTTRPPKIMEITSLDDVQE